MALRFPRLLLIVAALVIFTGIPSFAEFYTDWLWYQELGYEQVFLKSLSAQATTGMAVGAPRNVVEGSTRVTSTSTRGRRRRRRQAASFSARLTSSHAPPAT